MNEMSFAKLGWAWSVRMRRRYSDVYKLVWRLVSGKGCGKKEIIDWICSWEGVKSFIEIVTGSKIKSNPIWLILQFSSHKYLILSWTFCFHSMDHKSNPWLRITSTFLPFLLIPSFWHQNCKRLKRISNGNQQDGCWCHMDTWMSQMRSDGNNDRHCFI